MYFFRRSAKGFLGLNAHMALSFPFGVHPHVQPLVVKNSTFFLRFLLLGGNFLGLYIDKVRAK